jgi:hypothetical protein
LYFFTDDNVLESLSSSVSTTISADGAKISAGFIKSNDLSALCLEICQYSIELSDTDESEIKLIDAKLSNPKKAPEHELFANSDNFVTSSSSTDLLNIDWTKLNSSKWSEFIKIVPTEEAKRIDISISMSWKVNNSRFILLPAFILVTLLYVICIVILILSKRNSRKGRHAGDIKTISEIVRNDRDGFELPKSEQIRNVREFSKHHNIGSSSLVTNTLAGNDNANYWSSPIADNNWKHSFDSAISLQTDPQNTEAVTIEPQTNLPLGTSVNFEASKRLSESGKIHLGQLGMTRKDLRKNDQLGGDNNEY